MSNKIRYSITMDNITEKTHILKLEHSSITFSVAQFMKHKNVFIQYKCLWEKKDNSYIPLNLKIEKVWRNMDKTDKEDEVISWTEEELLENIKSYFYSVIKIHANELSIFIEF